MRCCAFTITHTHIYTQESKQKKERKMYTIDLNDGTILPPIIIETNKRKKKSKKGVWTTK